MKKARTLLTVTAAAAAAVALSLGAATTAAAAPQAASTSVSTSTSTPTYSFTFNLLAPNAAVTFTVNGTVVGTGTTDDAGYVSISYQPVGLAPGYYRLVATVDAIPALTSSAAFGVQ